MNVCPSCFIDKELEAFISSSSSKGDCDVCESKQTPILPLIELLDFFQELVDNFRVIETGIGLKSKIKLHWSFFRSDEIGSKILNEVLPKLTTDIVHAEIKVDFNLDIIENVSYWNILKEEIKWSTRFLFNTNYLTDDLGWDGFFNTQFQLKPRTLFYRARIHHQSGEKPYKPEQMGSPEKLKASGGRANPMGIPFLYLSDKASTTLYEVRGSFLDEISIGTFHLAQEQEEIKIVDFTEDPSLYQPGRVNTIIKAHLLKKLISDDLSKPVRRYDTEMDYIPTQFICEFIRIITNAKGIQFRSSLDPTGKNLVIFDQSLMKCSNVKMVRINSSTLNFKEVPLRERDI